MAGAAGPLARVREVQARRLRTFTILHAAGVAVTLVVVGWLIWGSRMPSLLGSLVFLAIIMPAGVPLVWWLNHRAFQRTMDAFGGFRPRIAEVKFAFGAGYILVLDNGLVLGLDPRTTALRLVAFFSAGGVLVHADVTRAERWVMRIRGMQSEGTITNNKGPAEARAELERFRVAFGAKWCMLSLREVRPEHMAADEPMWHESLAFFIPRRRDHARTVAAELDSPAAFLEAARTKCFPQGAAAPLRWRGDIRTRVSRRPGRGEAAPAVHARR